MSIYVCREKTPHDFNKLDNHMHQFKGSSSRSTSISSQLASCKNYRINSCICMHGLITAIMVYSERVYQYILCWLLTEQARTNLTTLFGNWCSIGAKKVKDECQQFREYCKAGNGEGYVYLIDPIYIYISSIPLKRIVAGMGIHITYITKHISIYDR